MISKTSLGHTGLWVCNYNVIQGSILPLYAIFKNICYFSPFLLLTPTIQNKYFGTLISDIFSQVSDTKFSKNGR